MSTVLRPELSISNQYHISKHRQYELKHFCLQYYEWKKIILQSNSIKSINYSNIHTNNTSDPTFNYYSYIQPYLDKIKLVEDTAINTDESISNYILLSVTKGYSYTYLKQVRNIPCSKDYFYERYRRFFWLLDKIRN